MAIAIFLYLGLERPEIIYEKIHWVLASVLLIFGYRLWRRDRSSSGARSNLGAAILGGGLIPLLVFQMQAQLERQLDDQNMRMTVSANRELPGINLSHRDLDSIYLGGKNLLKANLQGSSFDFASFAKSDLREADLTGASLQEADLQGTRLEGAILDDAFLWGANMDGARLEDVSAAGTIFASEEYYYNDDLPIALQGASLRNGDLSNAKLVGMEMHGTDLRGTNLYCADLRDADLSGAKIDLPLTSDVYERFRGVRYNSFTTWPGGFDPKRIPPLRPGRFCAP